MFSLQKVSCVKFKTHVCWMVKRVKHGETLIQELGTFNGEFQ